MTTAKEEYRVYFERYEVSNHGNVRRKLKTGYKQLLGGTNKGYKMIAICPLDHSQKVKLVSIHRMVAICFLQQPPSALHTEIDHIDRNRKNNHVSNLRWATNRMNVRNTSKYCDNIQHRTTQQGINKFISTVMVKGISYHKTFDTREHAEQWLENGNYTDAIKKRKQGQGCIQKLESQYSGLVKYVVRLQSKNKYVSKRFTTYEEATEFLASLTKT